MNDARSVQIEAGGQCFGCGHQNAIGLRLRFDDSPEGTTARLQLGSEYESYPGVIHGGIVATVLDELMARSVGPNVVTASMRVRYAQQMRVGVPYRAVAPRGAESGNVLRATARIESADGRLVAAAEGVFCRVDPSDAARGSVEFGSVAGAVGA